MAAVDFDEAYIHDGTALATYFRQAPIEISSAPSRRVDIQTYAGGRTRAVAGDAQPKQVTVTWNNVSVANREVLEGLRGDLILYRDGSGRMFYGIYESVDADDVIKPADTCRVTISISEVTHDIEV